MMEVVGTAAAIIQLAGVGFALAKNLYTLYDQGASGNEQVKELSFYIRSTSIAFEEVGKIFEEEGKSETPLISYNAIIDANEVVDRCMAIFNKLAQMAEDGQKNAIGLLTFLLKSSRLRVMQTRLDHSKVHLQLMMQIIACARLQSEPREGQGQIATEPDLRRLIGDLIDQRDAITREKQLAEQRAEAEDDLEPKPPLPLASLAVTDVGPQNPTSDPNGIRPNTLSPSQPPLQGSAPTEPPGHGKIQPSTGQAPKDNPRKADISYWSALYLVCCPCLARVKTSQTVVLGYDSLSRPSANEVQSAPSGIPAHRTTAPVYQNSPYGAVSELPTMLAPPPPAEPVIPVHPAPGPGDWNLPNGEIFELPAVSPQPPDISPAMTLLYDVMRDLQVDRLLREWTTVYDKPSFVVES